MTLIAISSSPLGYAYALVDRAPDAIPLLEQAVSGEGSDRPRRVAWLAEAHLLAGRSKEAMRLAGHALELARSQKVQGSEAWTLRLLGKIAAHGDSVASGPAEAGYQGALALATELGMRPLVAHCYLGLGTVASRIGDQAKARDHLTMATDLYRATDMRFWLEKAEVALNEVGSLPR